MGFIKTVLLALLVTVPMMCSDFTDNLLAATDVGLTGDIPKAERMMQALMKDVSDGQAAVVCNELGLLYAAAQRHADAERIYKRGLVLIENSRNEDRQLIRSMLTLNLAGLYIEMSHVEEAERMLAQTTADGLKRPVEVAQAHAIRASILCARGKLDESTKAYEEMLPELRSTSARWSKLNLASSLNNLGFIAVRKRNPQAAIRWFTEAAQVWTSIAGPKYPAVVWTTANMGFAYALLKRYDESAETYRQALRVSTEVFGGSDRVTVAIQLKLADVLKKCGQKEEARQMRREALEARGSLTTPAWQHTVDASALLKR